MAVDFLCLFVSFCGSLLIEFSFRLRRAKFLCVPCGKSFFCLLDRTTAQLSRTYFIVLARQKNAHSVPFVACIRCRCIEPLRTQRGAMAKIRTNESFWFSVESTEIEIFRLKTQPVRNQLSI